MMPHPIRLRHPWDEIPAATSGKISYRRRFNRPTGLGAHEVVMLEIDLSASDRHARVPIRIVQIDRAARVVRVDSADVTPMEGAVDEKRSDRTYADTGRVRYPSAAGDVVVDSRPEGA